MGVSKLSGNLNSGVNSSFKLSQRIPPSYSKQEQEQKTTEFSFLGELAV